MPAKHVCLITPGYISANPRLLKEATALSASGYRVTVLCNGEDPNQAERDQRLVAGFTRVVFKPRSPLVRRISRLRQMLAMRLGWLRHDSLRAFALSPLWPTLRASALGIRADLYIGHNLAALPVAAAAAAKYQAPFAFDAEDLHVEELPDSQADGLERACRRRAEARWLPLAAYVSAAAPLFEPYLRQHYGISAQVILNAFPRAMAPAAPSLSDDGSLYWVSQTIGPGRGLEAMLEILGLTRTRPPLRLRGAADPLFCERLIARAQALGVVLELLLTAAPEDMAVLARDCALGLAIEVEDGLNRQLCLTNKLFFYLLAGVPTLFSATPAQRAIAAELGCAAFVIDLNDHPGSAALVDAFLDDPERRRAAREHAYMLGQTRFNFEHETPKLLTLVAAALKGER